MLLRNILRNNWTLRNAITSDMLHLKRPSYIREEYNKQVSRMSICDSVFPIYYAPPFGIEILYYIVLHNPWIVDKKMVRAFSEKLPLDTPDQKNSISPLDVLMPNPVGIKLVCQCIATNPDILEKLDTDRIKFLFEEHISSKDVLSLLKSLSTQENGRAALTKLAIANPTFLPLIATILKDPPPQLPIDLCYPDIPFTYNFNPIIEEIELTKVRLEQLTSNKLKTPLPIQNLKALFEHPNAESLLFDVFPSV